MAIALVSPKLGTRRQAVVTVTTTAVQLAAANPNRKSVIFQNQGSTTAFIGPATVTASGATQGFALAGGASFTDNASGEPWYAIAASGSAPVLAIEVT
jgi:hypothetical protein